MEQSYLLLGWMLFFVCFHGRGESYDEDASLVVAQRIWFYACAWDGGRQLRLGEDFTVSKLFEVIET